MNFQLVNNLTRVDQEAVAAFFNRSIGNNEKCFEYLIQDAVAEGNYFIKVTENKVLVGRITEVGNEAQIQYLARNFEYKGLTNIENLSYKELSALADDVLRNSYLVTNSVYDELLRVGLTPIKSGSSTLMKDLNNVTIAVIYDGKMTPVKWSASYQSSSSATKIELENGYLLIKDGNNISFDLGFKNGRILQADECNNFMQIGKNADLMGQPYKAGSTVSDIILKENDIIYFVENYQSGTPNPGQFASKDEITTLKELREKLAVKEAWKETGRQPTLRAYRVKKDLRARSGIIGPQTEVDGQILSGGAHQYEILDYLGGQEISKPWTKYIEVIGDSEGIILK